MWGHGSKCRSYTTQPIVGGPEQDIEALCFPGQEPIVVAAAGSNLKDWTSLSLPAAKILRTYLTNSLIYWLEVQNSEARWLVFAFYLYHLLAVWLWVSDITSLGFNFLIHKVEDTEYLFYRIVIRIKLTCKIIHNSLLWLIADSHIHPWVVLKMQHLERGTLGKLKILVKWKVGPWATVF